MAERPLISRLLALVACGAVAAGLAACNDDAVPDDADLVAGKKAFVEKCGSCHKLARAGTQGAQGPDLDKAFARALRDGMGRGTVRGAVHTQILHPADVPASNEQAYMPANLVTGKLAHDVAAYVAQSAAAPGKDEGLLAAAAAAPVPPGETGTGKQLFAGGTGEAQACGACHALEDAGTSGPTGPDLDEVLSGQNAATIKDSIVNPSSKLTPGFGDLMPKNYGETLTEEQIKVLVEYLVEQAG